jgi:D-serine deaminase-like pyridoxal phosphate-dependent protein
MDYDYPLADPSHVLSPGLLFYKELIRRNIARMIEMAGGPERLRPHVKTHKTREITRLELEAGITRHKCATIAEAELLASCGVPDVLLAYPLVGPNAARMARLCQLFPECRFSALADDPDNVRTVSQTMSAAGLRLDLLMDVDVGQHRTGIPPGPEAVALYELIARSPGLRPGGLQVYDGHNHQDAPLEREASVKQLMEKVLQLRATLEKKGLPVPRMVVGGTPTFPIFARMKLPGQECSPGTCVLHDHGYGSHFADLPMFTPAALLLTRVISRPVGDRLTLDLGSKAIASDPPAGQRCHLLNLPEYEPLRQNEEHFVIRTPAADQFKIGDVIYAIPTHVCPTCALHRHALVVENRQVTERWEIVGRDRILSL